MWKIASIALVLQPQMVVYVCALLTPIAISLAPSADGDKSCDQLGEVAIEAARPSFGAPADSYLRAIRRGDFDEPFQPFWLMPQGICAYVVVNSGIEYSQGRLPIIHGAGPTEKAVLVLIDRKQPVGYALRGTDEPLVGFNLLTNGVRIKLSSRNGAESLFHVFLRLATDEGERKVESAGEAVWQVTGDRLRHSGECPEELLKHWKKENVRGLSEISGVRILEGEQDFIVTYYFVQRGRMHRRKIVFGSNASLRIAETIPITSSILGGK